MSASVASRGITTTVYLIVIQVVSRGLTFVGNQALLRYVLPEHFGLAVQLEALSVSVLYTSRESLRVALQRLPSQRSTRGTTVQNMELQSAVNASYLAVLLGVLLGLLLGSSYLLPAGSELVNTTHFRPAFWLYVLATLLELLSEPGFVVIQQNALFSVRARAETSAAITRCIAACLGAFIMNRMGSPMSVLPFALGQVCYAASLFIVYYWSAIAVAASERFSMIPKKLATHSDTFLSTVPKPLLALAGAFYGQSIFKWLLTQGDTLVLSVFADLEAQGIFALASNYGGLASRLLFQPVEESSRNVFGRLLSSDSGRTPQRKSNKTNPSSSVHQRLQAMNYLSTTLHVYVLIILMPCIAILPQVFPVLVSALLGPDSQWNSSATISLLRVYSYYVPTLALNGILDAFVTSVATEAELGAQSMMMLGVTMIYLSAAYFGMTIMQLGAVGLVYANILNMLLRIGFSLWFIRAWTEQNIPLKPGQEVSAFGDFLTKATPTSASFFSLVLVLFGLHAQDHIKTYLADNATVSELSRIKLGATGLDLFDVSYFFSAAVVLVSSIVMTEREFLVSTIEPLLPEGARNALRPYLMPQMQGQAQRSG